MQKFLVWNFKHVLKLVSNNRVYYFRNNRWTTWKTERYVKKVAEPAKGIVAYINTDQRIVRYNRDQKSILPGGAMNIAAGADGSLWIVDLDRRLKKLELGSYNFAWQHQKSWDLVEAKQYAIRDLAIDAKGLPWVLSKSNTIYRQVPGEAPDQLEVNDNSKSYILDLQRFCIQNHDEGWGKEEVKAHFYVYKGSKGRPLEAIGGTSIFINSDEGKFKNVRRTKARDLYVNNRKVSGVKLDNFEVHQNEGLIKIPQLRPGDFLIVTAIFNEMDGRQWFPMPLLEKSGPIPFPGQETKEEYYYSHFKMQSYTSTYDLNRRFQDYRDVLLRYYKKREEEENDLSGKDDHDYIGSDIELLLLGGKWPYENGNYLRLHGKNDAAHYFFEFTLRPE